jgi:hypothetical protein
VIKIADSVLRLQHMLGCVLRRYARWDPRGRLASRIA